VIAEKKILKTNANSAISGFGQRDWIGLHRSWRPCVVPDIWKTEGRNDKGGAPAGLPDDLTRRYTR
jgi:hypothetical protein